jgi:nucleotide-binding universal stress UspA family protein
MRVSARLSAVVMFAAIGVLALMFAGLLDWIVGVLFLLMEFLGETLRNIFARPKSQEKLDATRHRSPSSTGRSLMGRGRGVGYRRGRSRRRRPEPRKDGPGASKADAVPFRVLVPLSADDESLIDFVIEECLVRRAELLLLFLRPMAVMPMGPNPLPGLLEDDQAKATFDRVGELATQSSVPFRTFYETTADRPVTIGEVARATQADVVIVGSSRRNGVARFFTRDPNPSILKVLPERASLMIHAS